MTEVKYYQDRPLVSIITVHLNDEENLLKTIESILTQDVELYEHIIKDGGSRQDIERTTSPYRSPNLKVVISKDNGIYDAMNQGLEEANGKYAYFLNAGDVFAGPKSLRVIADAYERYGHVFLYCDYRNALSREISHYSKRMTARFLLTNTICHQAQFIPIDSGAKPHYDTSFRFLADKDLLVRLFCSGHNKNYFRKIDECLIEYMDGGFSSGSVITDQIERENFKIVRRNLGVVSYLVLSLVSILSLRNWRMQAARRRLEILASKS